MSFLLSNPNLANTMKRIVNSGKLQFTLSNLLHQLKDTFNVGAIKGKTIYFTEDDISKLRQILFNHGYDLNPLVDTKQLSRSERLAHGPNEKHGSDQLKKYRISIKPIGQETLFSISHTVLNIPKGSHLDIDYRECVLNPKDYDGIIVAENYENFVNLHEANIEFKLGLSRFIAVYRGDKQESRQDAVLAFLKTHNDIKQYWHTDIDPAGLRMPLSASNLGGLLAPSVEALEVAMRQDVKVKRSDLYLNQLNACEQTLNSLPEQHVVKPYWHFIRRHQAGIVQEQFIRLKMKLIFNER